jgi:hypothetical protein
MKVCHLFWLVCLIFSSCNAPRYVDFFPYHDDGTPKPKVAFLPVQVSHPEDREVADYLDGAIRWRAMDNGELYFYSAEAVQDFTPSRDPYQLAMSLKPADFVVETEIIQNGLVTYDNPVQTYYVNIPSKYRCARLLQVRMRITDIRAEKPRLVLYEVLESSQLLTTKESESRKAREVPEQMVEQALAKIEDTINSAK